MSVRPRYR
uniref:Uncharacterized protein n=1 Tax=Anguilla anguilla TaxID=7936 RepID=A0A0E9R0H8_ANGAN